MGDGGLVLKKLKDWRVGQGEHGLDRKVVLQIFAPKKGELQILVSCGDVGSGEIPPLSSTTRII